MQKVMHDSRVANISDLERPASIAIGGTLALLGFKRKSFLDYVWLALAAEMVRRGITGHCYVYEALGIQTAPKGQGAETTSVPYGSGIRLDSSVIVQRPRNELFRFWRKLGNLPKFMTHLESVTISDPVRSHWVMKGPAGSKLEWDAEIINEVENERIGWRSVEGSDVDHAGAVVFKEGPGGRSTIVSVHLQYNPPAGLVGAAFSSLMGENPDRLLKEDLKRFRRLMESREAAAEKTRTATSGGGFDKVTEASEESFPASDPPAFY